MAKRAEKDRSLSEKHKDDISRKKKKRGSNRRNKKKLDKMEER